jgi:hypothetical protein
MPSVRYDELQVEDVPDFKRSYKKIGIIAGAIILGCVIVIVLATTVPNSGKSNPNDQPPYFAFQNNSALFALDGPGPAAGIPCIADSTTSPANCKQRFVRCGTSDLTGAKAVILPAIDTACKSTRVYVGEICILIYEFRLYATFISL